MSALAALPAWATTGVGSLPFVDPRAAATHAVVAYDLPFCPQLPVLEGDMLAQWLGGDPRRCGWSPERDRRRPLVWDEWLAQITDRPPEHGMVKLQVTGPVTLACALERWGSGPPSRRAAVALAREAATWLAANAAAWVRTLADRGLHAVLVVDEPALDVFGVSGLEGVWEPLRASAPAWGLHLCCAVPWNLVERAEPDVLSFDLALAGLDRPAELALQRLLARGARIAWGALCAHRPEHALHALERLSAALERMDAPAAQCLLTASCGTGRMAPSREAEVAVALGDTARALRHRRPGAGVVDTGAAGGQRPSAKTCRHRAAHGSGTPTTATSRDGRME